MCWRELLRACTPSSAANVLERLLALADSTTSLAGGGQVPDRMLLMSSTALFFWRSAIPAGCVRWLVFLFWPIDETLACSF